MTIPAATDVRRKFLDFRMGRIAPEDFSEWVMVGAWSAPQEADPEVIRLLGKAELYVAEYTSGHRGIEELKDVIGALAVHAELDLRANRFPRYSTSSVAAVLTFGRLNCAV